MRRLWLKNLVPARISGLASCLYFSVLCTAFAATPSDDHQQAVAALTDVKAAINELVQIDASYSTDRNAYRAASQRAINVLAGEHGDGFVASGGVPSDPTGAIGHVDRLLDRNETPVWAAPLRGAEANMRAAVAHLQDSLQDRKLSDYQMSASRALTYLEVALGRPTQTGVLGGLEGALANTVLGVPAGAKQVDGCHPPSDAPAYGTHDGYLAWVALPGGDGPHSLPEALGGTEVVVRGGFITVQTAAASLVTSSCERVGASPQAAQPVAETAASSPASSVKEAPYPPAQTATQPSAPESAKTPSQQSPEPAASAQASGQPGVPELYTKVQAEQGRQIFDQKCVACHGENLQGMAAPSVAGNDFLQTAKRNGWTLAMIRYLVVNNMPLSAPSSLSPDQYASVLAYLLASNCYPAGTKSFRRRPSRRLPTSSLARSQANTRARTTGVSARWIDPMAPTMLDGHRTDIRQLISVPCPGAGLTANRFERGWPTARSRGSSPSEARLAFARKRAP